MVLKRRLYLLMNAHGCADYSVMLYIHIQAHLTPLTRWDHNGLDSLTTQYTLAEYIQN